MSKTIKTLPISNPESALDGFADDFDQIINNFLDFFRTPLLSDILRLIIIVFGASFIPKIPGNLSNVFDSPYIKFLAIFLLLWSGNNNPSRSLITALGIVIIINTMSGRNAFDFGETGIDNFASSNDKNLAFYQTPPQNILNNQGFSRSDDLDIHIFKDRSEFKSSSDDPITGTLGSYENPKVSRLNPKTPYSNDASGNVSGCAPVRSIERINAESASNILNEDNIPTGVNESEDAVVIY